MNAKRAIPMLSIEKRVRRRNIEDVCSRLGYLGTVTKCSQFGYVTVLWDNGTEDRFSPMTAATTLEEVTGDDALKRHDWDVDIDLENPPCRKCGIIQTDENEFDPCK